MSNISTPYEPTLEREWRQRIEAEFGRPILHSADCEELARDMKERRNCSLGSTTIKRMFGFAEESTKIRRSTYDVLAQYLGYKSVADMERDLGDTFLVSSYTAVPEIDVRKLEPGARVQITYDPKRRIVMRYLGDCRFEVEVSEESKLEAEDIVTLTHITLGFELIVSDLERAGIHIGPYHSAKAGGLTSIRIL